METETRDDALTIRLAHLLVSSSFFDFAEAVRRTEGATACDHFQSIEDTLAHRLFRFWTETEIGRARPDIIAAVAWHVRAVLREGRAEIAGPA